MMIDVHSKNCLDSFFSGSPDGHINISFCESPAFEEQSVPATTESLQTALYSHNLNQGSVALPDSLQGSESVLDSSEPTIDMSQPEPVEDEPQLPQKPAIRPFSN